MGGSAGVVLHPRSREYDSVLTNSRGPKRVWSGEGGKEGGGISAVERKDSHYKHSEVETRASNLGFPKIYLYGGKKKYF